MGRYFRGRTVLLLVNTMARSGARLGKAGHWGKKVAALVIVRETAPSGDINQIECDDSPMRNHDTGNRPDLPALLICRAGWAQCNLGSATITGPIIDHAVTRGNGGNRRLGRNLDCESAVGCLLIARYRSSQDRQVSAGKAEMEICSVGAVPLDASVRHAYAKPDDHFFSIRWDVKLTCVHRPLSGDVHIRVAQAARAALQVKRINRPRRREADIR